jgi:hypothetical protein
LRALGELMDDPDIRTGFAAAGLSTDIAALAPRRSGEMPRAGVTSAFASPGTTAFQGRYVGQSLQFSEPTPFPIEVELQRRGDRVEGRYSFGIGIGTLSGRASGEVLNFEW